MFFSTEIFSFIFFSLCQLNFDTICFSNFLLKTLCFFYVRKYFKLLNASCSDVDHNKAFRCYSGAGGDWFCQEKQGNIVSLYLQKRSLRLVMQNKKQCPMKNIGRLIIPVDIYYVTHLQCKNIATPLVRPYTRRFVQHFV